MKKLVAAATVLLTVAACTGCSSSDPTPNPGPNPAPAPTPGPSPGSDEQLLSTNDLDGDGSADSVFGVPKPDYNLYTSIRAVAADGTTLLALSNTDGNLTGALTAKVKAPTPILVVGRVGSGADDQLTAYLYDKATKQMVPVPWAGKGQAPLLGKADVTPFGQLTVDVLDTVRVPEPYWYKNGALEPVPYQ